ncbi:protein of unknown function [Taphrina deformans PYCC 5710]|uniref:5'-nucleotidase n=1 Tax=Taphrina deformans (strain PYCC 5710 / ATCC 11124 / CBS 356.35 / IMI 108563 / JCM 9778 / NBRC 8474) TaxID=1097556 RepID=R4XN24_TAPDE|nr:protein of unknown function [Taphrina deformans PYCC 5710]|eukprot:CCG84644.1 protein of unknown function [Taphrina deformans PYCC 5710]
MKSACQILLLWLAAAATSFAESAAHVPSTLSIIHVNDVHSHIDEFNKYGTDCVPSSLLNTATGPGCGGGYARIKATVDKLQSEHPHNLLLNAGDEFQGTMFYTYYKGEKTAEIVNEMKFDAATIGNHEFDDGPEHLASYLRNLTVPIVCANVNTSIKELSSQLIPYTIIERYQVGIIGVVTPETSSVSSPGEDVDFIEPIDLMQDLIDDLHSQGIKRIIALTHIGYGADIQLVQQTKGLSLVVGGHSHTFLGDVPGSEGPYPTVVQDLDGVDVPIVTNGKWGYNLGHLQVTFNDAGRVEVYSGQPIQLLAKDVKQDRKLQEQILAWKKPFLDFANEVVGFAKGSFAQMTCQITECSIGNLVADAMLAAHPQADLALVNAGGLRAGLVRGNITRGQVLTVLPFGSTLVDVSFTGQELWSVMEGIVSWENQETGHEITSFAQVSGIRLHYDSTRPRGSRMSSIHIASGGDGRYRDIDLLRNYTVCTLDFMVSGGDFWWPEKKGFTQTQKVDEVLVKYLHARPAVTPHLDGRIRDASFKGRVKAHAETILSNFQRVVELFLVCFGDFESAGMKLFEWIVLRFLDSFEGGQFR